MSSRKSWTPSESQSSLRVVSGLGMGADTETEPDWASSWLVPQFLEWTWTRTCIFCRYIKTYIFNTGCKDSPQSTVTFQISWINKSTLLFSTCIKSDYFKHNINETCLQFVHAVAFCSFICLVFNTTLFQNSWIKLIRK